MKSKNFNCLDCQSLNTPPKVGGSLVCSRCMIEKEVGTLEQEQIKELKIEVTKLKEEVAKLRDFLQEECKLTWYIRNTMVDVHGVDCKQSDDLRGVIMPDGKFIPYGEEYHKLYFLGKIRRP